MFTVSGGRACGLTMQRTAARASRLQSACLVAAVAERGSLGCLCALTFKSAATRLSLTVRRLPPVTHASPFPIRRSVVALIAAIGLLPVSMSSRRNSGICSLSWAYPLTARLRLGNAQDRHGHTYTLAPITAPIG